MGYSTKLAGTLLLVLVSLAHVPFGHWDGTCQVLLRVQVVDRSGKGIEGARFSASARFLTARDGLESTSSEEGLIVKRLLLFGSGGIGVLSRFGRYSASSVQFTIEIPSGKTKVVDLGPLEYSEIRFVWFPVSSRRVIEKTVVF